MNKKRLFLYFGALILMSASSSPNQARLLLSSLRGGEYVHAGDKESVDMVLSKILEISPHLQKGPMLDVGSGFGKTAHDFYEAGFAQVWGIDIDAAAVNYAKKQYPKVHFFVQDALGIEERFEPSFFSFISMFNVLYAIPEKKELLSSLFRVAKPSAVLVLFDYTIHQPEAQLFDLAGKPIYPIDMDEICRDLASTGWDLIEATDLSLEFVRWYENSLDKLDKRKEELLLAFSLQDIEKVRSTFISILSQIKTKKMGGAVIYAQKQLSNETS